MLLQNQYECLFFFCGTKKDHLWNVSVFCFSGSETLLSLILSFSQWYGESATTPSTTAACPCGWSRTIDAHYANRTGWYRGLASEDSSFGPTFPPSTLALVCLGRPDWLSEHLQPLNVWENLCARVWLSKWNQGCWQKSRWHWLAWPFYHLIQH